jgi:2-keto-3-deoxy-L-rhamnonate aldolase RhmA
VSGGIAIVLPFSAIDISTRIASLAPPYDTAPAILAASIEHVMPNEISTPAERRPLTGREIASALRAGRPVYSTSITSPSPYWPPFVKTLGVDFVFLDTEHVPQDRFTLSHMCRAYAALGIPPVVRIPCHDPYEACKVLDGGAQGIVAPYVETAAQVWALAGAVKYRPLKGARLQAALADPRSLEAELRDYLDRRNGDNILIVNIESVPAIDDLDAICGVPGLDAVLIGPHDLTCSLGIPEQYHHPKFDEATRHVFAVARKHNIGAGIHWWLDHESHVRWAQAGGNLVMHSSDVTAFSTTLRNGIAALRTALDG